MILMLLLMMSNLTIMTMMMILVMILIIRMIAILLLVLLLVLVLLLGLTGPMERIPKRPGESGTFFPEEGPGALFQEVLPGSSSRCGGCSPQMWISY